jgi:hypothetical protein
MSKVKTFYEKSEKKEKNKILHSVLGLLYDYVQSRKMEETSFVKWNTSFCAEFQALSFDTKKVF